MKTKIVWMHITRNGESYQGFWIVESDDDSVEINHSLPFMTKKDAQIYLGKNIQTWGDLAQFILVRQLPYKVVRFNMSNRGVLVDTICDENCADNLYAAREIALNTAYETHVVPVPVR